MTFGVAGREQGLSVEMFTFGGGLELPAFPEALAAHVHAHRWIVGTGVTGTAQQGCQTAQARARADTIAGITQG